MSSKVENPTFDTQNHKSRSRTLLERMKKLVEEQDHLLSVELEKHGQAEASATPEAPRIDDSVELEEHGQAEASDPPGAPRIDDNEAITESGAYRLLTSTVLGGGRLVRKTATPDKSLMDSDSDTETEMRENYTKRDSKHEGSRE